MSTWFRHDCDAHADPKLATVLAEKGAEGYGVYFLLIEALARESSHELKVSILPGLALKWGQKADTLKAYIEYFTSLDLLISDGVVFYSASLKTRMQQIDAKRSVTRDRVTRYRSVTDPSVTPPQSVTQKSVTPEPQRYTSNLIYSNQIKSNQIKSESVTPKPVTPEPPPDPYAVYRKHVDKVLKVPGDPPEPWESHNLYIGSGKRPCRNAEHVWLTPQQLVELWKLYDDTAGRDQSIPLFYDALKNTQAAAQAHIDQGRPIESFKAYNHLSSWKLQDAANTRAAVARMTRNIAKELSHP